MLIYFRTIIVFKGGENMNIVINDKKHIPFELPKMPFIISIESKEFRLVTDKGLEHGYYFFLTDLNSGSTWTADQYTHGFLKNKLISKEWSIIESTLTIENN